MQASQRAAEEKQKGNHAFANKDWATAVGHYTAAQMADPSEPTIPLNRAMAYIKLSKFEDAERDCTTALKLSPDNVKAFFRRATARVGADKLQEAKQDFEQVLKLDASNKEAKAEITRLTKVIAEAKPKRTQPLDLDSLAAPAPPQGSETPAQGGGSSVEAARKFLQQVGLDDPLVKETSEKPVREIPAKLPGETGGLLRPISTKRISLAATAPSPQTAEFAPSPSKEPPPPSATAKKTASALSFGLSPSPPAAKPVDVVRAIQAPSNRRLNAVEFERQWKECSRGPSPSERQVRFLQSVDPESFPAIMGQLLEPDLLSSLLSALAKSVLATIGQEDSTQRPIHLRDAKLLQVVRDFVTTLPLCQRFSFTVAMLDNSERRAALTLVNALEDNDALEPMQVARAHQLWNV